MEDTTDYALSTIRKMQITYLKLKGESMETEKFLYALNQVLPAVERKTVISQHDHFVFNKGNVSTYNGKIFFSHPVETDLNCSVVASDMLEIVKAIDSDTLELSLKDQTLTVKSSDVEATLSTEIHKDSVVQAIASMNLDSIDWDSLNSLPSDMLEGIRYCQFSVSKDANDIRNLHHIHIVDNIVESSDSYRCSEYIMDGSMEELLLPASSAVILTKQDPDKYCVSDGWVHFIDPHDVIFSIRVGEGDFPNIGKVIESVQSDNAYKVDLPPSLKDTLTKFTNISDSDMDVYKFVHLLIKDGKLSCSTNKETCKVKKTISFEDNKIDIEFFISPVFLSSIMEKTSVVRVNEEANSAIFSVSNFTHVVTLPEK